MNDVKLIWITPGADDLVAYMARVSAPENQQKSEGSMRLINYLIKHKHWSPFEMVSACIEITTTRDIGRQLLRHRSFSFQEFSQRYASVDLLPQSDLREARLQDTKNRQNSISCDDPILEQEWLAQQNNARTKALEAYEWALGKGIAKEVARAVLPEGLTTSRLYMVGNLRSWLTYLAVRDGNGTQIEHSEIARKTKTILCSHVPLIMEAFECHAEGL